MNQKGIGRSFVEIRLFIAALLRNSEPHNGKQPSKADQYVPLAISSNFLLRRASNILLDYSQPEQKCYCMETATPLIIFP
ncbi:hypothetical protein NC651_037129 [Populus alba x Populus x berolinensis]|nr:hypothetical protein NC651_037129 [Populus alba x Populus x berolinensis]